MTYDAGWPCCADFTRLTSENAALRAQLTAAEAIAELHLCTCEREQVGAPHEENCVLGRLIAARAQLTAAEQQLREAQRDRDVFKIKYETAKGIDQLLTEVGKPPHMEQDLKASYAKLDALAASPDQPTEGTRRWWCEACKREYDTINGGWLCGGHVLRPIKPTEGARE